MYRQAEKAQGRRTDLVGQPDQVNGEAPTLDQLGVSKEQSSQWQKLADVSDAKRKEATQIKDGNIPARMPESSVWKGDARETGRLIARLPKSKGGRKTHDTDVVRFLTDTGLERRTAERWQALATRITDTVFDETIEAIKAPVPSLTMG